MNLRVLIMKEYFTFHKTPRLEPNHQMQFNVIPRTVNSFKYCYLPLIILFLFPCIQLNGFKYYNLILIIISNIDCLQIVKLFPV